MRGAWGLIGLLIALAIVGLTARQQLASHRAGPAALAPGAKPSAPAQAQAIEQRVQDDVQRLMDQRASQVDGQLDGPGPGRTQP